MLRGAFRSDTELLRENTRRCQVLPGTVRGVYSAPVQDAASKKPASPWPRWRAYVLAVALTAAVLLLRSALTPWVGDRPLIILFIIPIVIAAYVGGLRPGLLATALVGVLTAYFVFPPVGSFWFDKTLDFAQWLFTLLEGVLISVLFEELQQWRDRTRVRSAERQSATTERKVRAAFAVALTLLGAIGIVSYLSVARLNENSVQVAHSHEVMAVIDDMMTNATSAESAHRAFIISGEEQFARDFEEIASRTDSLAQRLQALVADNPAQSLRVDPFAEALATRHAHSRGAIKLRREGGLDAILKMGKGPRPGVALQTQLRTLAAEMKGAEQRLLDERARSARGSAVTSQVVIVGGSVFALIFVSLALYAIRRDFAGRERAESELKRFFDLSIDLFVIASGDGYFKRMSPAVTDMLGYSLEEALAIGYMEMMHPDDHPRAIVELERQMRDGARVDNFEARFRHKDGSYRVLSWRSMPQGDLMFATARDVTDAAAAADALREAKDQLEERVEQRTRELAQANETLRKSERRFRALIEHGSDSIALIDASNRILYLSPAVANVEGYQPEELLGRLGTEHTHPDDLPVINAAVEKLLAHPGKPIPVVWRRRHKDGRLDLARGRRHQPARRPFRGRHRHQLPRHLRAAGARVAHGRAAAAAGVAVAHHARHRRSPGPAQHLPGGGAQRRGRTAGGFLQHRPVRRRRQLAHRRPASASASAPVATALGLNEDSRRTHRRERHSRAACSGHLVYEPDITDSQVSVSRHGSQRPACARWSSLRCSWRARYSVYW